MLTADQVEYDTLSIARLFGLATQNDDPFIATSA